MIVRERYMRLIRDFMDKPVIKIITGMRRSGKSALLELTRQELLDRGVDRKNIIFINFESLRYEALRDYKALYAEIIKIAGQTEGRIYVLLDEIQEVNTWEQVINSLRVDLDCDIYVTGSNAYLLSSEYSTYLSGRCVEIKMLPLSFREFVYFYDFEIKETPSALGGTRRYAIDKNGERYDLRELFDGYMRFGGMSGIADVGLDLEKAMLFLDGIYSTVVIRNILEREKRKGQKQITDAVLLRKIILFLADNIGNSVSITSIGNTLVNEGLLENGSREGKPSVHTVQAYINTLFESYFFYEIKRFDIKGKEYLRTLGKYYIVDIGIRNYLLGMRNRDTGHAIENVVYFELLRRGYDVAIGKIDNAEVDFIATNTENKIYIQVTESMQSEDVRKRELAPLQKIKDNYEKIILSLDTGSDTSFE